MSRDVVDILRPYVFDFVVGILWIVAIATWSISFHDIRVLAAELEAIALKAPHIVLPDFAVGFVIVIAGVIVPYCITAALRPFNLVIMNVLLIVQRKRFKREERLRAVALKREANTAVSEVMRSEHSVGSDAKLHFLTLRAEPLAGSLKMARQNVDFRAALIMPVSLLLGGLSFHALDAALIAPVPLFGAVVAAVIAYACGVWVANNDLDRYKESLDYAILMVAGAAPGKPHAPRN